MWPILADSGRFRPIPADSDRFRPIPADSGRFCGRFCGRLWPIVADFRKIGEASGTKSAYHPVHRSTRSFDRALVPSIHTSSRPLALILVGSLCLIHQYCPDCPELSLLNWCHTAKWSRGPCRLQRHVGANARRAQKIVRFGMRQDLTENADANIEVMNYFTD